MKRMWMVGVCVCLAGAALFAGGGRAQGAPLREKVAEERVELGGELNGRWLAPSAAASWDGRVVLILHGLASDSEGPADAQRRLAEALASKGIASLRINFRGEGDAARTELESTFDGYQEDVATARAWLVARPGVAMARVGVFGWSMGGANAIVASGQNPAWFRTVAVWSSTSGDLEELVTKRDFAAAAEEARRTGRGRHTFPGWKTVTFRQEFFESLRGVDVDAELAKFPGAFLSVRGTADYLPAAEAKWLAVAKGRPAEAVLIAGGDHIFNVFEPGAPQFGQAVAVTVAWFERTL